MIKWVKSTWIWHRNRAKLKDNVNNNIIDLTGIFGHGYEPSINKVDKYLSKITKK